MRIIAQRLFKIIILVGIIFFHIGGNYQLFAAATELTFTETSNNNWGSGFCYGFTAENTGAEDITNWVIGLNIEGGVNNGWGADFSAIGGGDYELTSSSSQKDALSPGEKVDIGFCGNAPGNITNIHLKSFTPVSGVVLQDYTIITSVLQVDVTTTSSWGGGYCRKVLLTNISDEIINDWQVNFELDQVLSSSNSANYTQNGFYYTVTPLSWNQELSVGKSTKIGFCTSGVNVDNSWSIGILSVGDEVGDIIPPIISSAFPDENQLLPSGNFDFTFEYADDLTGTGIDISSDVIHLYEWDGFNWGEDISATYINLQTKNITETGALYSVLNLIGGKYKVNFSISDLDENLTSTGVVFDVDSVAIDNIQPTILLTSHENDTLYPNSDFELLFNYTDAQSGINTSSLTIMLQKWDNSDYSEDISDTYIDKVGAVIDNSNANFYVNKLGYGKYKLTYSIEDNSGNTKIETLVFYIDEPKISMNKGVLDLGNITPGIDNFSEEAFVITVETLGAGFHLYVNKESSFLYDSVEITDWNGINGFGYEVSPYTENINLIGKNQIIGTQDTGINVNGERNTYIYYIKFAAKINELQAAGNYSAFVSFGAAFNYE